MTLYNVLYVESGTWGGGSFESLYQQLRVINRDKFRPVVVYLSENRYFELVKELDIPVYILTDWIYSVWIPRYIRGLLGRIDIFLDKHFPFLYILFVRFIHHGLIYRLQDIVQKEKIDLIHLNDQINRDLFGVIVAEKTGITCISHLRSMRGVKFDKVRAGYVNQIVSSFIANSNATKKYWASVGISSNLIKVVYNAIVDECVQPIEIRNTWKLDIRFTHIVGCVGNLNSAKGYSFLLRSFAKFVESHPDTILLIVGDGPQKNKLIQQTRLSGLQDSVKFIGYDPRAREIIANLDILVLPSKSESFGRVLLEAMQVGTPVIATNRGGIPEVINNGFNGMLVDYDDESGLVKAMDRLLSDNSYCKNLVNNGYLTLKKRFNIDIYASEIENIYLDALSNRVQ